MIIIKLFAFIMWSLIIWAATACVWYQNGLKDGAAKYKIALEKIKKLIEKYPPSKPNEKGIIIGRFKTFEEAENYSSNYALQSGLSTKVRFSSNLKDAELPIIVYLEGEKDEEN